MKGGPDDVGTGAWDVPLRRRAYAPNSSGIWTRPFNR
jgi:hypothetical protein